MNENKKNVLNLSDPIMNAWPDEAFFFSIVGTCKTGYEWLLCNMVQIVMETDDIRRINYTPSAKHHILINRFDFCPFIEKYIMPRTLLYNYVKSLSDIVISAISNGYYVSTMLSQFFRIKAHKFDENFFHANYIYGYDISEDKFYIADNFDDRRYSLIELSKEELDYAYKLTLKKEFMYPGNSAICFYKIKDYNYIFGIKQLIENLKCYLNLENKTMINDFLEHNMICGINCYEMLKNNIVYIEDNIDMRNFAFIVDVCKLNVKRVKYLCIQYNMVELTRLVEEYNTQYKTVKVILNLCIKHNLLEGKPKKREQIIKEIMERMDYFIRREKELTERLIQILTIV